MKVCLWREREGVRERERVMVQLMAELVLVVLYVLIAKHDTF